MGLSGPGTAHGAEVHELGADRTLVALPALRELRGHLDADDAVVRARIDEVQRAQGYRLLGVLLPGEPDAVAVAGFRAISNLAWGEVLYVDDLSTRTAWRGRGYATVLLHRLDDEARGLGCSSVELDSGVGPHRADAHRRYLGHGYRISSHHFSRETGTTTAPVPSDAWTR